MSTAAGAAGSPSPALLSTLQAATLLALLLGLQPVITDLYLPALPSIAREMRAPLAATQMTMSALILAFGLTQLVWGAVSDRFGRRPVLLLALALMVAASVGGALAPGIGWLIFWRIAQGATLAATVVCARAMLRDLYEPARGAHVMSLGLSGLGLVAIGSPLVGGVLAGAFGWRACLAAVAVCAAITWLAVALRLPETLARPNPDALQWHSLMRNARTVLAHPTFRAWALLVAATYSGLFMLLSASSYAYIGVLGLSSAQYGVALASNSVVYVLGTFVCRRWLRLHGMVGTVHRGAFFSIAGGLGMAACGFMATPSLAAVLLSQSLYAFGHGMHQPCGQAGAVGPFPQMAGAASALAGCVLALVAFAVGMWLGAALDGTLRPLGLGMAVSGCATALIAWTLVRKVDHPRSGFAAPPRGGAAGGPAEPDPRRPLG
jgi:DHA1 family bicyclomycin/chloramphenicol resistance-like MFS transporter